MVVVGEREHIWVQQVALTVELVLEDLDGLAVQLQTYGDPSERLHGLLEHSEV